MAEKRRFHALDGWRGLCALLIALHHFPARGVIYHLPLVRNAWILVDFFFVLSGFVIAHAYRDTLQVRDSALRFVMRRFFRLWPLHVAVLAAFVALETYRYLATGSGFTGERSVFAIFTNLALIQSLGVHNGLTWNTPAWAVSVEFWTYAVFAFFSVIAARWRNLAFVILIALSVAALALVSRYGMRETFDWGIARCLYGFLLGVLTYEAWLRGWRLSGTFWESFGLAAALLFLVFIPGHRALEYLAPPVFALFVVAFAGDGGALSRMMAHPGLARLGAWSYAIYMVQMLVIAGIVSAAVALSPANTALDESGATYIHFSTPLADDILTVTYLLIVIALAAAAWRFIEMPGQNLPRLFKRAASAKVAPETGAQ